MNLFSCLVLLLCCGDAFRIRDGVDDRRQGRFKRVIGGREVGKGDWPWLVHVNGKIPVKKFLGIPIRYMSIECTGSLVGSRWVLTAAHCISLNSYGVSESELMTPKYWHAKLGEVESRNSIKQMMMNTVNRMLNDLFFKSYFIHASKIVVHPSFDPANPTVNDIALLKLEQPVHTSYTTINDDDDDDDGATGDDDDDIVDDDDDDIFSTLMSAARSVKDSVQENFKQLRGQLGSGGVEKDDSVGLIRLANQNDTFMRQEGTRCVVKGWGCETKGGPKSLVAKESEMRMVDMDVCRTFWSDINDHQYVCAGGLLQVNGICSGDSGGPLACRNGDEWVQVGVASFTNLDHSNVPSVFTRVAHHFEWIMEVMETE